MLKSQQNTDHHTVIDLFAGCGGLSPTITGSPDDYIHYSGPRIMIVRKCTRIQSFPYWYKMKNEYTSGGKMRKLEVPRYTHIGNAIPPLFAELAEKVEKQYLISCSCTESLFVTKLN